MTFKVGLRGVLRFLPFLIGIAVALSIASIPIDKILLLDLQDVSDFHREIMLPNPQEFSALYSLDGSIVRDILGSHGTILARPRVITQAGSVDVSLRVNIDTLAVADIGIGLLSPGVWPNQWTSIYNPYLKSLHSLPLVAQDDSIRILATSPFPQIQGVSVREALSLMPPGTRVATNAWSRLVSFPESSDFAEPAFETTEGLPEGLASPPTAQGKPDFWLGGSFTASTFLEKDALEIGVRFIETAAPPLGVSTVRVAYPHGAVLAEAHFQMGQWKLVDGDSSEFENGAFVFRDLPRGVYSISVFPSQGTFVERLSSNQPKLVLEAPFRLVPPTEDGIVDADRPAVLYTVNHNRKFMYVESLDVGFPYEVKLLQRSSNHTIGVWLWGEEYYAFLEEGETVLLTEKLGILVQAQAYFALEPERFFLPVKFDRVDLTGGVEEVAQRADYVFLDYSDPVEEGGGWFVLRKRWQRGEFPPNDGRLAFVLEVTGFGGQGTTSSSVALDWVEVIIHVQNLWSRWGWWG